MHSRALSACLTVLFLLAASMSLAQSPREDLIWARVASATPTLDGNLNEASWAAAESTHVEWAVDAGIPGSGWKVESGDATPGDPTFATLKFLVSGNQLYLGAIVRDRSVGGSRDFNRFDGFLMSLKDHADPAFPKPPAEYTYLWWYPTQDDPQPPGQSPSFVGKWATWPPGTPRTPTQIANWDAVTVVTGQSNNDAIVDTKYTVEMRFNLTPMGYDVTQAGGDIVEWNISIYDCDWFWPFDGTRFSSNRVWWQSPWSNSMWYNEVRVFARPDVTVSSGPVPAVGPELTLFEVGTTPPTVNGVLNEAIWSDPLVYTFDIRWDDSALRETYPGVGPSRSGQYQPSVAGGTALVLDPADATVKVFFQGDKLFMGFDVRDEAVQYHAQFDRWDGFLLNINERTTRGPDNNLLGRRLGFQVGPTGAALPSDYLSTLVAAGDAAVAIALKAGTVVDTTGTSPDTGYTAELAVDLTALSYPAGLDDGSIFFGVNHLDGDSYIPREDSYGTRTWWYREYENQCCNVWAYLSRTPLDVVPSGLDQPYALLGVYPNPSANPAIRFSTPQASTLVLDVFDVQGRLVRSMPFGVQAAGVGEIPFQGKGLGAGVYFYRLALGDPANGSSRAALHGRLVLAK